MAVNLLALANKLGSGLGSGSSGSRTRTSYKNQPGNLKRGTHIPGTNLKEDQGIRKIARKGRRGDTKLRRVGGQVAHVNTTEANAIDKLGPLGEAWVASIGSGSINPQTGRPEYWPKFLTPPKSVRQAVQGGLDYIKEELGPVGDYIGDRWDAGKGVSWRPSQGKWGIFGQTSASKERDKAKEDNKVRHDMFEDFRRKYEEENIAGIFTESEDDNTDLLTKYSGSEGFNKFVKNQSGMDHPTGTLGEHDIADYLDEYDERKETEIDETLTKSLDKAKISAKDLVAEREGTGKNLSSGLFGMLTESQDTTATKNFAGAGDFAAEFKKTQAIKEAESQFGGADRRQEELGIDIAQTVADAASETLDLQEDYNQEFWNNMVSWDSAVNA